MKSEFFCPLPWISVSTGAYGRHRTCCHQRGETSDNVRVKEALSRGEVPSACAGCHEIEAEGGFSFRQEYLERFGHDARDVVRYLDLTVDNQCNLACAMCSPAFSKTLIPVWEELGGKPPGPWKLAFDDERLARILPTLEMLTLKGGEPFLSAETRSLLRRVVTSGLAPRITLRLFTNLTSLSADMLELIAQFKDCDLVCSIDSVGENYEWVRFPAKWSKVRGNLDRLIELKPANTRVSTHAVAMALNWTRLGDLIRELSSVEGLESRVPSVARLERPFHVRPDVLTPSEYEQGRGEFLQALGEISGPSESEKRVISVWKTIAQDQDLEIHRNLALEYEIFCRKLKRARIQAQGRAGHAGHSETVYA